jgi:hypothetical protein
MNNPQVQKFAINGESDKEFPKHLRTILNNRPVVYVLQGKKIQGNQCAYVGETSNIFSRIKTHTNDKEKKDVL